MPPRLDRLAESQGCHGAGGGGGKAALLKTALAESFGIDRRRTRGARTRD